jgi:hypothetical protein
LFPKGARYPTLIQAAPTLSKVSNGSGVSGRVCGDGGGGGGDGGVEPIASAFTATEVKKAAQATGASNWRAISGLVLG